MARLLLEKMTDKLLSKNTPPTLPKRIGHSKHCRTISDHTLLFCKLPASGIANIFPHNHVNFVFHSLTYFLIQLCNQILFVATTIKMIFICSLCVATSRLLLHSNPDFPMLNSFHNGVFYTGRHRFRLATQTTKL